MAAWEVIQFQAIRVFFLPITFLFFDCLALVINPFWNDLHFLRFNFISAVLYFHRHLLQHGLLFKGCTKIPSFSKQGRAFRHSMRHYERQEKSLFIVRDLELPWKHFSFVLCISFHLPIPTFKAKCRAQTWSVQNHHLSVPVEKNPLNLSVHSESSQVTLNCLAIVLIFRGSINS